MCFKNNGVIVLEMKRDWTLAYFLAGGIGVVTILAMVTAPVSVLLGDSKYAVPSSLHGLSAIIYLVVATVLAYLGYRLFKGELTAYTDLRMLSGLNALFSLATIMFGNWIYIFYRAKTGPRTYFLENAPEIHKIFFEFKEFMALFTLPLAVGAAYILWKERDNIKEKVVLRQIVGALLILSWVYLMLTFGLGAAITKLKGV